MNQFLDETGYALIRRDLESARDCMRRTFQEFLKESVRNLEQTTDSLGQIEQCRKSLAKRLSTIEELLEKMDLFLEDYREVQQQGADALTQEEWEGYRSGSFWSLELAGSMLAYSDYKSYQFRYQYGRVFSEDYNDLGSFQNSEVFRHAAFLAGFAELSNYEIWYNTDKYAKERIEGAITSMLQNIPELKTSNELSKGTLKRFGETLGIEDLDSWVSQFESVFQKYAKSKRPVEELLEDPKFQDLLSTMTDDQVEMFRSAVEKTYSAVDKASEAVSTASDTLKVIDGGLVFLEFVMTDYTQQISYLDTMEDALLNAGFSSGLVLERIDALRELYRKDLEERLPEVLKEFAIEQGKEALTDKVKESIPLLRDVDFGLTFLSTGSELLFSEETEGFRSLSGFAMIDYSLTQAHENYVQLMEYGVATEQDMQEADRVFQMLYSVKLQEYDQMRTLCKGEDPELYDLYNRKYEELKAFESLSGTSQNVTPVKIAP